MFNECGTVADNAITTIVRPTKLTKKNPNEKDFLKERESKTKTDAKKERKSV